MTEAEPRYRQVLVWDIPTLTGRILSARRPKLTPTPPTHTGVLIPTSIVLQRLHDEAPADHFTLGWLMGTRCA